MGADASEDDTQLALDDSAGAEPQRPILDHRYELLGLLGSGGMGNVYKARDRELDEIIAVKVLRPELASAAGAMERFRREVKLARRVSHPNVARVFDLGDHGTDKIITMALIDGEPLSAILARGRPPLARTVDIAGGICAGVGAAHAAGVIHRDLKPENVMIAKDDRVVVMDFGIARAIASSAVARSAAGLVGTPAYMAPEQVDERETIDERADIYAFGVMLFEMLTGELPWKGESIIAVAAARLMRPPPDPRTVRADLPPAIAALVLRCMARHAGDRYATMLDVSTALAGVTLPALGQPSLVPRALTAIDELPQAGFRRVAVLPFKNLGAAEEDYVAEGLTDDLIDLLSAGRKLRVTSRGVVMKYKGSDRDLRDVGRELDVNVVVEGSVRRAGGALRIQARLVSVADGFQLWSRRFQGADVELLALNDAVAAAVAAALLVDLDAEKRGAIGDVEASDLYLRARSAYRRFFVEGSDDAISLFEHAHARTPNDPRIIAGLVMARAQFGRSRVTPGDSSAPPPSFLDTLASLRAEALRAIDLAPSLAEAHTALGYVTFQMGDEANAIVALRRGALLAPNDIDAHDTLGRILSEADRDEGARHLQTALVLEPHLEQARMALARQQWLRGDHDLALATLEGGVGGLRVPMAARLAMWGNDKSLAERLLTDRALGPTQGVRGVVFAMLELVVFGRAIEPSALAPPPGAVSPRLGAFLAQIRTEVACVLGDRAGALAELENAANGALFDLAWIRRCPLLAPLRDDPAFVAIEARIAERAAKIVEAYVAPLA